MARKKYYNNYRKSNYKTKKEKEFEFIMGVSILFVIFFYMTYIKFIRPNLDNIIFFLTIFIPFLLIIGGVIFYYIYNKNNKIKIEKIKNTPNFLLELEKNIKGFKPLRKYDKEEFYQTGLYGNLQKDYPNLEIEKSIDYSRPDIIIDNIAIEIKGPTNMSGLKTLPDKINHYLPKRDYLFIVLFDINISSKVSKEENMKIYEDKKREILENTIPEKRNKIFFIEM